MGLRNIGKEYSLLSDHVEGIQTVLKHARHQVGKVIIGQREVIDLTLIAIFTGGHVLIEGTPGIAKTLLVRTLAQLLGCEFNRIQFTPDVSPADIIGSKVFNPQTNEFVLVKGPIFTTFLLGDEINRAPARAQSALLQAMQEHQVTIDRTTHMLSPNFTVFATLNPSDYQGTFPLPEPQRDRFLFKIIMDYPNPEEEFKLCEQTLTQQAPEKIIESGVIKPLLSSERLILLRNALDLITMSPELIQYAVNITQRSRNHNSIQLGAGPRATQSLVLTSRAKAALEGRDYVTPEDIRAMALACMEHRLILKPSFIEEGLTCTEVIRHILQSVDVPNSA